MALSLLKGDSRRLPCEPILKKLLKAVSHWASHGVADLRSGVIFALLVGLTGTLPVGKVTDLHPRWNHYLIILVPCLSLGQLTWSENPQPAVQDCGLLLSGGFS